MLEYIAPPLIVYVGLAPEHLQLSGLEMWRFVVTARYFRQFSDSDGSGSTSAMLPPEDYFATGNMELLFWQSISFLYITFSEKSLPIYAAVVSGIPVFGMTLYRLYTRQASKAMTFVIICALLSFLIYAPFMVNGGNIFRIRLILLVMLLFFLILPRSASMAPSTTKV